MITNSMDKLVVAQFVKKYPQFIETEILLVR
jgi:hypothetical protein